MLHRGYEVWISTVDGQRIPEYNMELEGADGKTVACYIPSESGQRFIINWRDHNGQHRTSFKCILDGKWAGATASSPDHAGSRMGLRTTADPNSYSPYQFADLRTTDDENALWATGAASLEKVGTIEVRAVRIQAQTRVLPYKPCSFRGVDAVHERSKKLGAHCATLGRAVVRGKPHAQCMSVPLDPREGAYATFVFRYRPQALLQAQDIMPPAKPAHNASPGVQKGKARASANDICGPSSSRIKRESSGRVKAEPGAASLSRVSPMGGDVIELSDSDDERVERKPRIKPERVKLVKADPDDVIDLTLDG